MGNTRVKKEEYCNIVELYLQGSSHKEIEKIYNCGATTIGNILKRMGVPSRPGGSKITQSDVLEICKMYKNGKITMHGKRNKVCSFNIISLQIDEVICKKSNTIMIISRCCSIC